MLSRELPVSWHFLLTVIFAATYSSHLLMSKVKIKAKPFTREFVRRLKEIEDPRVRGYLRIINSINDENEASRLITREASSNNDGKLMMSILGIPFFTTILMVSGVGGILRFPDAYHLISCAGWSPSTHSSGGITYHGRNPIQFGEFH